MSETKWTRRAFLAATTTTAAMVAGGCATKPNTAKVVPRKSIAECEVEYRGCWCGRHG